MHLLSFLPICKMLQEFDPSSRLTTTSFSIFSLKSLVIFMGELRKDSIF